MPIARQSASVLAKVMSGGGQNFGVPARWLQSTYGSGLPIAPLMAPKDTEMPRSIDYPIAVNTTLVPRIAYGLLPFAASYNAYSVVPECAIPVNLIARELMSFKPQLKDADDNEVSGHDYQWMCESPDRKNPWTVWSTRFFKSCKIYDAAAVYLQRNAQGTIDALHYVDGSTLFVIVDESGQIPAPEPISSYLARIAQQPVHPRETPLPAGAPPPLTDVREFIDKYVTRRQAGRSVPDKIPAFTQIIKGTPFAWWSSDDIWYMPQSPRLNAPYGESFIEQAWVWVMIIASLAAFEMGHYRTGNMPEGFVTLPESWLNNPDQLEALELAFNQRMTSNPVTERNRLRFFPQGSVYTQTKKADFPQLLYRTAWHNILHTIGIPPSEVGDVPGQGLGGKGFKEGAASDLSRNTLNPHRNFIAALFNYVLERDGVDDVHFALGYPTEEIDPNKLKQDVYDGMAHGTLTLNDALGQLGFNPVQGSIETDSQGNQIPIPSHIANKHLIVAGSTIYVVEDMQTQNGLAVPPLQPGGGAAGGPPVGPESVVEQDGKEHTPEDFKTIQEAIRQALDTGTLDGKFVSVPTVVRPAVAQPAETPDIPPDVMQAGIVDELVEHPELSLGLIEQLVRDHLRVDPHYYDKRTTAEPIRPPVLFNAHELREKALEALNKHCGVCPEDDDYLGAPISREVQFTFPNGHHANEVEIVAMVPDGLPPRAALWKPEGGEVPGLQDYIGGPQYVREEAAYLLDRSLGFQLVPVAYVAESYGEVGAAIYYTFDADPGKPVDQYAPEWIERAAVLDYIMSQRDRGTAGHNFLTHPDDPARPILIDNGLTFPTNSALYCESGFCAAMLNKPLSAATLAALTLCRGDASTWHDIQVLVGPAATEKARVCLQRLLDERAITAYEELAPASSGSSGL